MKQTHTRREKGRAVFLVALMVLSVFAMSASFAGSVAADATDVQVDDVDLADESSVDVDVSHGDDAAVAIAIVDGEGETVHTAEEDESPDSTHTFSVNVENWDLGEYTVYAEAGDSVDASALDDESAEATGSLAVSSHRFITSSAGVRLLSA